MLQTSFLPPALIAWLLFLCKINVGNSFLLPQQHHAFRQGIPLPRKKSLATYSSSQIGGYYAPTKSQSSNRSKKQNRPSKSKVNASKQLYKPQLQNKTTKTSQQKNIAIDECKTMGEAIQNAITVTDFLNIVEKFVWLPTDEDLPPHLRTQAIHHEKRRRWGSQLLEGLGQAALALWENDDTLLLENERNLFLVGGNNDGVPLNNIWADERFVRAVLSVSIPFEGGGAENRVEKEGVWVASALKGLHVLSGCVSPLAPSSSDSSEWETWLNFHRGVSTLIQTADSLLSDQHASMKDAVETRWAIRGLVKRLQMANSLETLQIEDHFDEAKNILLFTTPKLNSRASNLPFDILHHCLPWQMNSSHDENYLGYRTRNLLHDLLQSIPFHFDTLTTRTGNSVIERRGTAWLAEEGIGALAYSGKLMSPVAVPENVRGVMREVEQWCANQIPGKSEKHTQFVETSNLSDENSQIEKSFVEFVWEDNTSSNLPFDELGQFLTADPALTFFDCSLCNHYPTGNSACKFHTDPEHGSHWHRTTAVVSCGTSRKFAFRPIPEISTWDEWDNHRKNHKRQRDDTDCAPALLQLFPGDVVLMTGECNDVFHHAVYASPFDGIGSSSRVSLVFKRALDRGGGKRGHSLAGEGRRARRRNSELQQ
mmetsp:Transcript_7937/g.15914  ORF Transcript_7937/g.15914 Transcript_7937/m.15914 type:complete len:653 (+) Transcript_7937:332-2290(+)